MNNITDTLTRIQELLGDNKTEKILETIWQHAEAFKADGCLERMTVHVALSDE